MNRTRCRTAARWTLPTGGGAGTRWRTDRVGLPVRVRFDHVATPEVGPDWQFHIQFLFPR